jgi:hypothetical protein
VSSLGLLCKSVPVLGYADVFDDSRPSLAPPAARRIRNPSYLLGCAGRAQQYHAQGLSDERPWRKFHRFHNHNRMVLTCRPRRDKNGTGNVAEAGVFAG